jgi:hypothetical protein
MLNLLDNFQDMGMGVYMEMETDMDPHADTDSVGHEHKQGQHLTDILQKKTEH